MSTIDYSAVYKQGISIKERHELHTLVSEMAHSAMLLALETTGVNIDAPMDSLGSSVGSALVVMSGLRVEDDYKSKHLPSLKSNPEVFKTLILACSYLGARVGLDREVSFEFLIDHLDAYILKVAQTLNLAKHD